MADFLNDFRSRLNRGRWLVFAIGFLYLALFALLLSSRIKANAEGLSWMSAVVYSMDFGVRHFFLSSLIVLNFFGWLAIFVQFVVRGHPYRIPYFLMYCLCILVIAPILSRTLFRASVFFLRSFGLF